MKKNSVFNRLAMLVVYLFLYAPIFVLIVFSFNSTKGRTWTGFSLQWYQELLQNRRIISALQTTLLVSILSALIAVVIGTAAAIGFYSMKKRWRGVFLTVNNIPLTNADIVTGVSMMLLFAAAASILNFEIMGFGTLLIAHITFNIPYVILSVMPKLRQLDSNVFEAAQDLGAGTLYAFRKVIFPEIRPGVVNGLLMAFTMSFDDFVISYFTAGSSVSTLSMEVYSMARRRISPEINALSTLMFAAVLALLVIVNVRQERQEKAQQKRVAKFVPDDAQISLDVAE